MEHDLKNLSEIPDRAGPDDVAGDCAWVLRQLDDFCDRELSPESAARVSAHLATCASCAQAHADLERLLATAAALPHHLDPPHDLWPQIAVQLQAPAARRHSRGRDRRWGWGQALAALWFMALGALFGHWLLPRGEPSAVPNSGEAAGAEASSAVAFATLEADYLRAKEHLWVGVLARQAELSPDLQAVVERNLQIIDQAIWDLRQAVTKEPGNRQLERLLLAQHRRQIALLRRLATVAS